MIIRRRHTANFATISNALRDDERLKADEVGILYCLLTYPPDWEIRRPALRKRWGLGPKGLKRIVDNWMRTGWCRVEKVRLKGTGQFHYNYEIWPEPGPGMTDEEIRLVLSVESIEPDTDEEASSFENEQDNTTETTLPSATSGSPPTGDGGVAHVESTKYQLLNTIPTKAAAAIWSELRKAWPSTDILSPNVCEKLFAALSPDDRQKAFDGIAPYLVNCRAKNRKLCDLKTYLSEKRFKGNLAIPVTSFAIVGNTPQAFRWLDYWRATGQPTDFAQSRWRQGKPYYETTEWPPPLPASAKAS